MLLHEVPNGSYRDQPGFDHLANLFTPTTVDTCSLHDGTGLVGGDKNEEGKWNTAGPCTVERSYTAPRQSAGSLDG